ncbi:MAG: hypothetical protein KQH79_12355 [Bacteroidetes bacterium]|nr:hypothetical protein [Bacteroidota bacterium]
MNNNKLNIDKYTQDLIGKGGVQEPDSGFTKSVMSKILKDPEVNVSFFTLDDRRSNIWLIISMVIMVLGFFIFYHFYFGLNVDEVATGIKSSVTTSVFAGFFSKLWTELTISPYLLVALAGVMLLVIIDKTIVKYLHSL